MKPMPAAFSAILAAALFATTPVLAAPPEQPTTRAVAASTSPASPRPDAAGARTTPVGFPHDAGAHDADAAIEWWYFNAFLKTASGRHYAVVGSFFRTGIQATKKGHYLIYSLTDLDSKRVIANGSVLDQANVALLKAYLPLMAMRNPDDPGLLKTLAALQKNKMPAPHRASRETAVVVNKPRFAISFDGNAFAQKTANGRTWRATLKDPAFSLSLDFAQPTRPAMLVGGAGMTGLNRPDDMFYVSLTRADASGTLTVDGKTESVAGTGWIDRQWGRSWIVGNNGWDWFGAHLDNGADLIVYRVKDNDTGKVLRAEATLLNADGTQTVDKAVTFAATGEWLDPASGIAFPESFAVTLANIGYTLRFEPVFDAQAIPTIGIGAAFWEGVVSVTGTDKTGAPVTGRGYRELVGYKARPTPKTAATAKP